MNSSGRTESGQVLLVVLLIMAVVLTIALSVVSRSVTDISVSKKEDSSARAFSAAEAGIERTLTSGTAIVAPENLSSGGIISNTTITALVSGGKDFQLPLLLSSGETAPIWFVSHKPDGTLDCNSGAQPCSTANAVNLCWGEAGTANSADTTPAIELSVIYTPDNSYDNTRVGRVAFDPHPTRSNGFDKSNIIANCSVNGKTYAFGKTFNLTDLGVIQRPNAQTLKGPQMARVRLFYNTDKAHSVGFSLTDSAVLPQQGNLIESTGSSDNATRKIQVYQLYPDLPPIFDFAVFAGSGGLQK